MQTPTIAMHHIVHMNVAEKRFHLLQFVEKLQSSRTKIIVLTGRNYTSDELSICLNLHGFKASSIHNEKPQHQNDRSIEQFNQGRYNILVTSNFDVTRNAPRAMQLINFDMFTPSVMLHEAPEPEDVHYVF